MALTTEQIALIRKLLAKENNPENAEYMAAIAEKYKLPAAEVVAIGQALLAHEDGVNAAVKGIKFNGQDAAVDPETGVATINYSESVAYYAQLVSDTDSSPSYVVKDGGKFPVKLRFSGFKMDALGNTNLNENGTLTISRSTDNGSNFVSLATQPMTSLASDATNFTTSLDLGDYINAGTRNIIRLQVVVSFEDDFGAIQSRTSRIDFNIQSVNLAITNNAAYNVPIYAEGKTTFPLDFSISGSVSKKVHIEVTGSGTGDSYERTNFTANSLNIELTDTEAKGLLTHGVHAVIAYVSCDDGKGGTLYSDVIVNRYMVVNNDATAAQKAKTYFLLQQQVSYDNYSAGIFASAVNYVQTSICDYSVFKPQLDANGNVTGINTETGVDVAFLVTKYVEDGIAEYNKGNLVEYLRSEVSVTAGTRNSLPTTIEIEAEGSGEEPTSYNANFYVWQFGEDGKPTDFSGVAGLMQIFVDNSQSYSPTSGATFLLNPKVRNNSEANPARILNARNNNAVIDSVFTGFTFGDNDGWVRAGDDQQVLRIPAGSSVNIKYNPFAQFYATPESSMTMEIDFAIRNVTDPEEAQTIGINEQNGEQYIGLRMEGLRGFLMPNSAKTKPDVHDFSWQEGVRTHVVINIVTGYHTNPNGCIGGDETQDTPINLVSIFVNGKINRQFEFAIDREERDEWCTGAMSNGGIFIGSNAADIDLYSLRVYSNRALTHTMCLNNYISSLPTSEQKVKVRKENNIVDENGLIVASQVRAQGKRVLILHCQKEPNHTTTSKRPCYWEVYQYNADGTINNDCSGTIGKQSYLDFLESGVNTDDDAPLIASRQGSTANTYYWSNHQTKIKDITHKIVVYLSADDAPVGAPYLHSSIKATKGDTSVTISGGNLKGSFNYANAAKTAIIINDGWVDFNNAYRGLGFRTSPEIPLGQKMVNKINYASSMQSHLQGGVRSYNDLHKRCVPNNDMLLKTANARVAKYTEPFFFFVQNDEGGEPIYRGASTFGVGKMDDVTYGLSKSDHPNFCMLEGAENNYPLTDFRVPFSFSQVVRHFDKGEIDAYCYPNSADGKDYSSSKNIDVDKYASKAKDADGNEIPSATIEQYIENFFNFVYLHAPNLAYYNGSLEDFLKGTPDRMKKYWMATGSHQYELYRFDYVTGEWVAAGLWNGTAYETIKLSTYSMTKAAFDACTTKTDLQILNDVFQSAIVAHAKANIGDVIHVESAKFHYCYTNFFLAGTDNCSKNTYYVLVPFTENGVTKWLFELHQDDLDTILATDNSAYQSKPYYIDRQHPCKDGTNTSLYEGDNNMLFNLMEAMWGKPNHKVEGNTELQTMMYSIFSAMSAMAGSVWDFMQSYFFSVQEYFPAVAYNEGARIRYAYPCSLGFTSDERHVPPIEQSLGDQLEAEKQYMVRRIIYAASYAEFGAFESRSAGGSLGIADAVDTFGVQAAPNPDGTICSYAFELVPHQYIYPSSTKGGNMAAHPHIRVAPNEKYTLVLGDESGDTGLQILGANYFRSFGNVGDLAFRNNYRLTINGKRLTEFVAHPTKTFVDTDPTSATYGQRICAFRPNIVSIGSATNIKNLDLGGMNQTQGSISLTGLTRLETLDMSNSQFEQVYLPQSELFKTAKLGYNLSRLSVSECPNLESLTLDGYSNLRSVLIGTGLDSIDTYAIVAGAYNAGANLTSLTMYDIEWNSCEISVFQWMMEIKELRVTGSVNIREVSTLTPSITFDYKVAVIDKFGNVDDENADDFGGLKVTYLYRAFTGATIQGNFYNDGSDSYKFKLLPQSAYSNAFTNIKWSVTPATKGGSWHIDERTGELYVDSLGKPLTPQ